MAEMMGVHARVGDLAVPHVPSRRGHCDKCGAAIWIQAGMHMDSHICSVCWLGSADGAGELEVTDETRQQLRQFGWTDEQIERGLKAGERLHKRVQEAGGLM